MLGAMFTGMHRHTRSSKYMDRKAMKRTVKANRPGNLGFSFTGEFPEVSDWAPVEAQSRRRSYTRSTGRVHAVNTIAHEKTERLPVVNRYGVRLGAALVFFVVFGSLLAMTALMVSAGNGSVVTRLEQQTARRNELIEEQSTLAGEIAFRSNGLNVRQEAMRIGLRSSENMQVIYLDVPTNAMHSQDSFAAQNMANILGQR